MDDVRAVEAKSLEGAEDYQLQFLRTLDRRYNQTSCETVGDCFVTWHPSVIPLHLEFHFEFQDSDYACNHLADVFDEKTGYPRLYAIELVAATRTRYLKTKAEIQLLLDQVNKIMADNSTRAWWLPIIRERVRQNTIKEAQKIKANHQDLQHLDVAAVKMLGNLVNEGEIDAVLLRTLVPSRDGSSGVDSSNVDRAESGSPQGLSNPPVHIPGAQSSHDASIASSAKKDAKNQRKKNKKQAKWLAKNQDPAQGDAPGDPSIAKGDASAISAESGHPEYPTDAEPGSSATLNTPERLEDTIIETKNE